MSPGETAAVTFYVKNTGNVQEVFNFTVGGWNPSYAGQYFTLSWDYNNAAVAKNQAITVSMYLAVATNIVDVTTFSNEITIGATRI